MHIAIIRNYLFFAHLKVLLLNLDLGNYLYINNDGQVAETDLIIQFKSDKIYFESRNNKEENNIDSGS